MPIHPNHDEIYKQIPNKPNQYTSYEVSKHETKPCAGTLASNHLVNVSSSVYIKFAEGTTTKELSTSPCKDSYCNANETCYTEKERDRKYQNENNGKLECERKNTWNQVRKEVSHLQKQYDILKASLDKMSLSNAMRQYPY